VRCVGWIEVDARATRRLGEPLPRAAPLNAGTTVCAGAGLEGPIFWNPVLSVRNPGDHRAARCVVRRACPSLFGIYTENRGPLVLILEPFFNWIEIGLWGSLIATSAGLPV